MLDKIGQAIAVTASDIIGYSVLITDREGVVLGASDVSRLGTLHEASIEVIRTGRQVLHDEKQARALRGTLPGTTLPILLGGEVVGSIGISGQPEEISRYGMLIKMLAEVFLRDRMELESNRLRDQNMQNLLHEVITLQENSNNHMAIINHGQLLGYDLLLPRIAVLVEIRRPSNQLGKGLYNVDDFTKVKQVFENPQDFKVTMGENRYVVFASVHSCASRAQSVQRIKERCNNLVEQFASINVPVLAGISSQTKDLPSLQQAYYDADKALTIAKKRMCSGYLFINDIPLEKLILEIPRQSYVRVCEEFLLPIRDSKNEQEIFELICCWCESRFSFIHTARKLNIHKNTLVYRFARLKELTGIDLYDFNCTMALYLSIQLYKLHNDM